MKFSWNFSLLLNYRWILGIVHKCFLSIFFIFSVLYVKIVFFFTFSLDKMWNMYWNTKCLFFLTFFYYSMERFSHFVLKNVLVVYKLLDLVQIEVFNLGISVFWIRVKSWNKEDKNIVNKCWCNFLVVSPLIHFTLYHNFQFFFFFVIRKWDQILVFFL